MSQFDAASELAVSLARVGFLIQGGTLDPAHNSAGEAGVTVESVERQRRRRHGAGVVRRMWLLAVDAVRSLGRGI